MACLPRANISVPHLGDRLRHLSAPPLCYPCRPVAHRDRKFAEWAAIRRSWTPSANGVLWPPVPEFLGGSFLVFCVFAGTASLGARGRAQIRGTEIATSRRGQRIPGGDRPTVSAGDLLAVPNSFWHARRPSDFLVVFFISAPNDAPAPHSFSADWFASFSSALRHARSSQRCSRPKSSPEVALEEVAENPLKCTILNATPQRAFEVPRRTFRCPRMDGDFSSIFIKTKGI